MKKTTKNNILKHWLTVIAIAVAEYTVQICKRDVQSAKTDFRFVYHCMNNLPSALANEILQEEGLQNIAVTGTECSINEIKQSKSGSF